MSDIPDWIVDDYVREECACGHSRTKHLGGDGACREMRKAVDYGALPEPADDETFEENPFGWPTNWPEPLQCPQIDVPCCHRFSQPEPSEPEWS